MKFFFNGVEQPSSIRPSAGLKPESSFVFTQERSAFSGPVELEPTADEVFALHFEDGSSWWLHPAELKEILPNTERATLSEDRIMIPARIILPTEERGFKELLLKGLDLFKAPIAKVTAEWAGKQVDAKLVEEGLYLIDRDFKQTRFDPNNAPGRSDADQGKEKWLLFLHGTVASFQGSFGQLKDSTLWQELYDRYAGRVLAFDHYTTSKSPVRNLLDLLEELPSGYTLDLISQSRGGIVGDLLARCATPTPAFKEAEIALLADGEFAGEMEGLRQLNAQAAKHELQVENFVRVACPIRGTTLMTGRLDIALNIILNVLLKITGAELIPVIRALKTLLLATVRERTNPAVLPGLAIMRPDTDFHAFLENARTTVPSDLRIIAGVHERGNWKQSLMYHLTRAIFRRDNDYVVDTAAKYAGFRRTKPTSYFRTHGGSVHHFAYYRNPESRTAIEAALTAAPGKIPEGFRPVEPDMFIVERSTDRSGVSDGERGLGRKSLLALIRKSTAHEPDRLPEPPVDIRLKMGHMKYADHPILVGHFRDDGIVSAERVLDVLLQHKLSEAHRLGIYPGAPETNRIMLPNEKRKLGAIVVGLGVPEGLSSMVLAKTVEKACLKYVEHATEQGHATDKPLGVSSLMVGSGYGNLTLSASIHAILEGVFAANRRILTLKVESPPVSSAVAEHGNETEDTGTSDAPSLPLITEVEFIEIFRGKALNAFYILDDLTNEQNHFNLKFDGRLHPVEGSRDLLPLGREKNWWMRLAIRFDTTDRSFLYAAATGRARVSNRVSKIRRTSIQRLITNNDFKKQWNRKISHTLFEMLVPNDFKMAFRNQKNVLLVLDKAMAEYPWELLHYERESSDPLCTRTGFIRQLATLHDRPILNQVYHNTALVVGDPQLRGQYSQLPGALREARAVKRLLEPKFAPVNLVEHPTYTEFVTNFYQPYRVVHIASHGVVEHDVDGRPATGILLEDGEVFTPDYVNQSSSTPELVFLNCCHLGDVDEGREAYTQSRSRLAANLGVQFIENGVKAVVVAGWAVDDKAAELFATTFYTQMMAGATFGTAVQKARAACYRDYPHLSTWGAYQCYGDQFFTLTSASRKERSKALKYLLPHEVVIDLERLLDDTRSVRTRRGNLRERLEAIIVAVEAEADELRTAPIVQLQASIYAELGLYKEAVATYRSLWTMPVADWQFLAVEQYQNLRMAALWKEHAGGGRKRADIYREMQEVVKDIESLIATFGENTERFNIMGSAHKRCYLAATKRRRPHHLKKALYYYNKARESAAAPDHKDHYYALCNWLAIAELSDPENVLKILANRPTEVFLSEYLKQLEDNQGIRIEFWDEVRLVNVLTVLLLSHANLDHAEETAEKIKEQYQKAWNLGGSTRNRDSEVFQVTFLLTLLQDTVVGDQLKQDGRRQALEGLYTFFSGLE